jgi:heme oxygenase
MMYQTTPLTESLQAATYDQNVRIGTLPFFKTMSLHPIAPQSYISLLRGLKTIYDAFEQALVNSGNTAAQKVWSSDLHKQALIEQDLATIKAQVPYVPAAELTAEALAEHIRLRAAEQPRSLIGSAYALATWYTGDSAVAEHVHAVLGLPADAGVSYLESFNSWNQNHWSEFAAHLNSIVLDQQGLKLIIEAAQEALHGIEQLIDQLHPINEQPISKLAKGLNVEAGNHLIAEDMTEIKAMMRAHKRINEMFPYVDIRYGTRGRKFSWTDGGWLVSLLKDTQENTNQQVQWLTRVLAVRGMPHWLLECYLPILAEELTNAVPEKREKYQQLRVAADMLADQRRATISDEMMAQLDAQFYEQVGAEWQTWMPNCGNLLASAVAVEQAGLEHVVSEIEGWMTDPARFPEPWIAAVHDVIAQARSLSSDEPQMINNER